MEGEPADDPIDDPLENPIDDPANDMVGGPVEVNHRPAEQYFHPTHRLTLEESQYVLGSTDFTRCDWLPLREHGTPLDENGYPDRWHLNAEGDILFLIHHECCFRMDNAIARKFRHLKPNPDRKFNFVSVLDDKNGMFKWQTSLATCLGRAFGFFYLIQSGEYYKIGISQDMTQRYRKYVTESPHENRIIFGTYCGGYDQVEKLIKEHFKAKLHRGEW